MQTNESSECQNQPDAAQVDGIVHTDIANAIAEFQRAKQELEEAVKAEFPIGRRVAVNLDRVTAIAVVHAYVAGFPDRLALLFENGNVWDKPVEKISRLV
jgi:hypothetical protein